MTPALQTDKGDAHGAIAALEQGRWGEAERLANAGVASSPKNPYPRLVRAIARHKRSIEQLSIDGLALGASGFESGRINQKYLQSALGDAELELAKVEEDLAVAARRSDLSLELCLACWDVDWNGNGRVDQRDRHLLEIEQDEAGNPIPEGDPRRRPTFRFDDGDVPWARAFVSFERAALDVVLAYDWTEVARLARSRREMPERITIRLVQPDRIAQAKQRLLEGLDQSDAARRAYLVETDDDREWVPSPRQQSHPMPLSVDQPLYDTWGAVVGDVRKIVEGKEVVPVAELLLLSGERMRNAPRGALDLGRMLSHPKDVVFDLRDLERMDHGRDMEGAMEAVFGDNYVRDKRLSPLPKRLERMKREIDAHEGEIDRKLRYLFWLN